MIYGSEGVVIGFPTQIHLILIEKGVIMWWIMLVYDIDFWLLVFVVTGLVCATVGQKMALKKGRNPKQAFWLGFALNGIGLAIVALLPSGTKDMAKHRVFAVESNQCLECSGPVPSEAEISTYFPTPLTSSPRRILLFSCLGFIAGFLFCSLIGIPLGWIKGDYFGSWYVVSSISMGFLGAFGGLGLGWTQSSRTNLYRWILAGYFGALIGFLIYSPLSNFLYGKIDMTLWDLLTVVILGLCLGAGFALMPENSKNREILFLTGFLSFLFMEGILILLPSVTRISSQFLQVLVVVVFDLFRGVMIGLCFGLVFLVERTKFCFNSRS